MPKDFTKKIIITLCISLLLPNTARALTMKEILQGYDDLRPGQVLGAITQIPNFGHIQTGTITYSTPPSNVLAWQAGHHDFFIAGPDPRPYNPNVLWVTYKDFQFIYLSEIWNLRSHASANGFYEDDYFIHMSVDYNNNGRPWNAMDKFGIWENGKGVFTYNSSFTDKTTDAYDADSGDVPITKSLYLGYGVPFDRVNFNLSQFQSGGTVSWEYYNGNDWSPLILRSDETNNLSTNGLVVFTPPADWLATSVNGSKNKWWVRLTVNGAVTNPIATSIKGDDWKTDGISRGWAASNTGRVVCCGGSYEYDPNPPAGASARFKFQSRVAAGWSANASFIGNHSKVINNRRPWTEFLADLVIADIKARNISGIMLDDLNSIYTGNINSPSDWKLKMDWGSTTFTEYMQHIVDSYKVFTDLIHTAVPSAKVGGNCAACKEPGLLSGDYVLIENFSGITPGEMNFNPATSEAITFDDFLPANNPLGTKGYLMLMDSYSADKLDYFGNWHAWDKGNRRPIASLAFYYIGSNGPSGNTYLHYNSLGVTYSESDEVWYYSDSVGTLSSPLSVSTTYTQKSIYGDFTSFPSKGTIKIGNLGEHIDSFTKASNSELRFSEPVYNAYPAGTPVSFVLSARQSSSLSIPLEKIHRWSNWFPAMGIDVGVPDSSGHNGGSRDLAFRTPTQLGDTGRNIWRRDYTKAVMLLRPATYATSAAQINTFSQSIDLGGTYYPLYADGTTGSGITSISLRHGEGAILMKSPTTPTNYIPPVTPITPTPTPTPTTVDTTAPVISAVTSSNITSTSAKITWTTNEASDSQIEYGLSSAYGAVSPVDTILTLNHIVNFSNLTPNTTYYYRVKSRDLSGNLSISQGQSFTTIAVLATPTPTPTPTPTVTPTPTPTQTTTTGEWYNPSFTYKKTLTINKAQIQGTLTNFPVLVSVTDPELKSTSNSGKVASTLGYDLVFTISNNTKLSHEIEKYDPATGQLIAWVKVPSLTSAADTTLNLYFGNSSASDQQDKQNVWDSSYKGVWHLSKDTTLSGLDSSANGADGTITGSTVAIGNIDGGANFDGNDLIETSTVDKFDNMSAGLTMSGWVKFPNYSSFQRIATIADSAYYDYVGFLQAAQTSGKIQFGSGVSRYKIGTTALAADTWYHVTGVTDYTSAGTKIYLNGVDEGGTVAATPTYTADVGKGQVGALRYHNVNYYTTGVLDEVRISNTARSSDWIKTEYNNQNSPSTFMSVSSAVGYTPPATVTPTPTPTPTPEATPTPSVTSTTPTVPVVTFQNTPAPNTPLPSQTNTSTSTSVSLNPIKPFSRETLGTLRLINQDGTFYLVQNGYKHGITNPGMLFSYGFTFSQGKPATQNDKALPEGEILMPNDGSLVKSKEDPTVYLVSRGLRHGFSSQEVFLSLGYKFSSVLLVTDPELQKLPKGIVFTDPTKAHFDGTDVNIDGTVYLIKNQTLYGYPSLKVYNSWHIPGDITKIVKANSADRQLPKGSIVELRVVE